MSKIKYMPAGDKALVAEFGNQIEEGLNQQVHHLAARLTKACIPGVQELLPTFRSLMIYYNPLEIRYGELKKQVESLAEDMGEAVENRKRILKIPCCYGARFGPDLRDMEQYTGMDREEIIRLHSSVDYKIYMMGFLPGFVYLGGLDKRLEMPRLTTPRVKIFAGAVGIGGSQTGVYPLASPGGWRLIGGTPVDFYDPDRENPILCEAGEYIRFVPITVDDYYDIRRLVAKGEYKLEAIEEEVC